ncbi:MAG: hypothetical protein JWL62_3849 [Hyphomicrobiales bacterium]|nr:hypothetical protein [Hyphomicrobiales bacterium]
MSRYVRAGLFFRARTWASLALIVLAAPADAQTQHLIPSPYPPADGSARIQAETSSRGRRHLVPLPYPGSLGPNALGNPTGRITTR